MPYNKLLTNRACSSRTGEYWPSVVFVWTLLRSVHTVTTSGQYSPVRPSHSVIKRLIFCFHRKTFYLKSIQLNSGVDWICFASKHKSEGVSCSHAPWLIQCILLSFDWLRYFLSVTEGTFVYSSLSCSVFYWLYNSHIFDYPDSRLCEPFSPCPLSLDNQGLTVRWLQLKFRARLFESWSSFNPRIKR